MRPPKPALKYQLLPEARELRPGNPIQGYQRCVAYENEYFLGNEANDKLQKWLGLPLGELPDEVKGHLERGPLKLFDDAARLDSPDWGVLDSLKRDGLQADTPGWLFLRRLVDWNALRMRFELQEARFDDFVRSTKSLLQLARHLDESHDLPLGNAFGLTFAHLAVAPLEEMTTRPGAPNLFWAYSFLPSPLVPVLNGARRARDMGHLAFAEQLDPNRVWGKEEIAQGDQLMASISAGDTELVEKLKEWSRERRTSKTWLAEKRKELIEERFPPEKVRQYPPGQLVFHEFMKRCQIGLDERMKYAHLPFWQIDERAKAVERTADGGDGLFDPVVFSLLLSRKRAQARIEQRFYLLRVIEALRWYAAENDGKLPEKLSDFKEPLPDDPVTGKPFRYERDGATAHLRAGAPRGFEKKAAYNLYYEIMVRPNEK